MTYIVQKGMMKMSKINEATYFLSDRVKNIIDKIDKDYKEMINEIRIRNNNPIAVKLKDKILYVTENSKLVFNFNDRLVRVTQDEMDESFNRLCKFSVYSYLNDIRNGFITLNGGHRVGFCATAVRDNDDVLSLKDISSFNIRISREFNNCGDKIFDCMKNNGFGNVLIVGQPSSGKTTLLRDIARLLSNNRFNVCVVDERQELFSKNCNYDKGYNTDVFLSYPKHTGIQTAIRTMSPDYIITDEICEEKECEAICNALNSGVKFALSIHSQSIDELKNKYIFRRIIETASFDYIVLLQGKDNPGEIKQIMSSNEVFHNNINTYCFSA